MTSDSEPRSHPDLRLLYRDGQLVAFDKPPGLLTIPGRDAQSGHLLGEGFRLLAEAGASQRKLFVVHRLDRLTSGLVLFALDPSSHRALCLQFQQREVEKRYLALVHLVPKVQSGMLVSSMVPARRGFMRQARQGEAGAEAVTGYRVLDAGRAEGALLELTPRTGRMHQIRLQLADLGSPIVGEPHYHPIGGATARTASRLWLHAWRLRFRHPTTGESIALEAPPPRELEPPAT